MRKNKNMRRFNDEQTKLLETMFEAESRPESRMKQQLAKAVGLRPRQVAIWFQNRRARLKTKQIERDYYMLKASYDNLASSLESLKRDKQSLLLQLQKLKVLLGKPHGNKNGNSSDVRPVQIDPTSESKEKPDLLLSGSVNHKTNALSVAKSGDVECCGPCGEETGILNIEEPTDDSLTSSGDWCSFNCSGFLDQSSGSSNWWEFLS